MAANSPHLEALDQFETLVARPADSALDGEALLSAARGLPARLPSSPTADLIQRLFFACYTCLGLTDDRIHKLPPETQKRLEWAATRVLDNIVHDTGAGNRWYVQSSLTRTIALGRTPQAGAPTAPVPLVHIPLHEDEARDLVRPYLQWIEGHIEAAPFVHLKLCWNVKSNPQTPFDRIFDAWLKDIDARGIGTGDSHSAVERAFALAALAEKARQRMTWAQCTSEVLPQLLDPHPMVAACAARFLGVLYSEPETLFNSAPKPLAWVLNLLADIEVNRRAVAGGFLRGLDVESIDPFEAMRADPQLVGFDIDAWALAIFADTTPEPYLPGTQAFWFYVHEAFCARPDFIDRLIDLNHPWEALMCATEPTEAVDGMQPVLKRLVGLNLEGVSPAARGCLTRLYTGD